jgi:8-oxo-dGTP diphosphatase
MSISNEFKERYSNGIFNLSIPVLALDLVIFTIYQNEFCVLLVERTREPEAGKLMLPGGIMKSGHSLEANFDDILKRRTNIDANEAGVYKEQLYSFGEPGRDPRGHIVTVTYYAFVAKDRLLKTADLAKVRIIPVSKLPEFELAFDHARIIAYAKERMGYKLEYTDVAKNILSERFSLSELQHVYETVLSRPFDKRNFRKKILSLGIIRETGVTDKSGSKRPAMLYEFSNRKRELRIVEIA